MKTLALSACLAVASTAVGADLKDPAEVAGDWNKTIADARTPVLSVGPLGLTATPPTSPLILPTTPLILSVAPARRPLFRNDVLSPPHGWEIDPKMERIVPGEMPPKGAKPWYYRGQKFWIIPIASAEK